MKINLYKSDLISRLLIISLVVFLAIFSEPIFLDTVYSAEESTAEDQKKEIEFWTINLRPKFDPYFLDKFAEYEAKNKDVKIIWHDLSFYSISQKLKFRIAEENAPQLVNLSPQLMTSFLLEDLLYPISNLEEDLQKNYYPNLWESGIYNNQAFAFPWYFSSKVMAYNREILSIAGLEPENPPETYEELFQMAERIKKKTGVHAFMPQVKIHQEFLKAGIKLFAEVEGRLEPVFNTDKALEIIKAYQSLAENDIVPSDSLSTGFNIALERYMENDLAILITSPQFLKRIESESEYLKDMTAVAVLPSYDTNLVEASLMNLVIPKSADLKKETADFAAFISSAEAQLEFARISGVLPSADIEKAGLYNTEIIQREDYNNNNHSNSETKLLPSKEAELILYKQLAKSRDFTLIQQNSAQLIKVMEEQFARAFAGKISAEEALNLMEKGCREILNE